jgi:DNA-binding cell septation regulator SpoVG
MKIVGMFKRQGEGKIKAFFNIEIGPLVIRDVKLIQGETGLWAAMPSKEYTAKDGQKKWAGVVQVNDEALMEKISIMASKYYNGEASQDEPDDIPW